MNNIESNHLEQNPFLVPPGYFDALPVLVATKIGSKAIWPYKTILKPLLSLAASFVVLFGLGYGILSLTTSKRADTDLFTTETLISRFNTYLLLNNMNEIEEGFDSEEIITFLTDHGVLHFSIAALD